MRRLGHWLVWLFVVASLTAGCSITTSPSSEQKTPVVITAMPQAFEPSPTPPSAFPDVDGFVSRLLDSYDIPGAGVALVRNGAVTYVQGYGVRSTATGAPVTPDTLFAIGSVTKSFTALDVLQLVDRGQVTLDAPLTRYLPDFMLTDPGVAERITVRHLLAQSSGLPGGNDAAWYGGRITTLEAAVDFAAGLSLAAAPGTTHIYSNYNYAIAGYLIEQVTGMAWTASLRTSILTPLEMTDATFDVQTMQQTSNHAVPHRFDVLDGMQPRSFVSLAGIASAGALNASARGMGNYVLLQLNDGAFDGTQLLAPSLLAEMHTQQIAYPPQPPIGPTGFQTQGYALGWFTATFNGRDVLWHNGSIDGFYAIVLFIPAEDVGVAVLSNAGLGTGSLFALATGLGLLEQMMGVEPDRDVVTALNEEASFDPIARQIALEAARAYQADPAEWTPLLGAYSGSAGDTQVELREGALYLSSESGSQRLVPMGPASFVTANRNRDGLITTYTFATGAGGMLTLFRDGVPIGSKL